MNTINSAPVTQPINKSLYSTAPNKRVQKSTRYSDRKNPRRNKAGGAPQGGEPEGGTINEYA